MFMNAYYSKGLGLSGGDKRSVEILRRWMRDGKKLPTILAPGKIFEIFDREGIRGFSSVVTSDARSQEGNIVLAYLVHTRNAMKYIRKLCRSHKSNGAAEQETIFYTTSDYVTDILPASYGKRHLRGAEWYAVIHHIIEDYHTRPGSRIHNWIAYKEQQFCIRRIVRDADHILTVSPLVYDYLARQGVPESRLGLVSNGIDDESVAKQNPFPDPDRHFDGIFVARFAPSKGILEFPAIWKQVTDAVPGARLCLIGEGSDEVKEQLMEAFRSYGIDKLVTMPGFISSGALYSWLKSAKVCVFPSHEEGWGIAIAEAMACGLPVVTYALPVFPAIFHGCNLSGPVGDTTAFAANVVSLLQDREKRRECGDKGKKLVDENYTWNRVALREWQILHDEKPPVNGAYSRQQKR